MREAVRKAPNAGLLVRWMRKQLAAAGARGFVVGLSGGVDSAVVARLAQLAAPDAVVAAILPCHSDPQDAHDAALVARHFDIITKHIDLTAAYDGLIGPAREALGPPRDPLTPTPERLPLANIKPRLRMAALYFLANSTDALVAGTSNRCEIAIGYFTKHGDGAADLLPIGHLVKSQVLALARDLDVPAAIIDRKPSAGLWLGQTDEEEIGFTYEELERYLDEGPQAVSPALAMRIERRTRLSDHKRHLPPTPTDG